MAFIITQSYKGKISPVRDYRVSGALPDVTENLKVSNGILQLKKCPGCATCYLFQTDYGFLYGSSEVEQKFTRLTEEMVAKYVILNGLV